MSHGPCSLRSAASRPGAALYRRSSPVRWPLAAAIVRPLSAALPLVMLAALGDLARAETLVMKDGRILEGSVGVTSGLSMNALAPPKPGAANIKPILFLDNNLTRTFVSKRRVAKTQEENAPPPTVKIKIPQRVAIAGFHIARMGPLVNVTPFDEFGRRTVTMMSDKGPINVVQGITEITPLWTKVEGLVSKPAYLWDMRLATSSIPRDILAKIIAKRTDPKNLNDRMTLVKLFVQSERYAEAESELEAIMQDFPGHEVLEKEVRAIRQLKSRRVIDEVNVRRKAGQNQLAIAMLENFPRKDIAGETLQQVRQQLEEYAAQQKQGDDLLAQLKEQLAGLKDAQIRTQAKPIVEEIAADLNFNLLERMADYQRLGAADDLSGDQRLALAISGWLLGANHATPNIAVALSLVEVRNLIRDYLREPVKMRRDGILQSMRSQEGSNPEMVARLIAHMRPPIDSPQPSADKPGLYELQVPSLEHDEPRVSYFVQLPPEYDPYRRYPTVVTLNGAGTTPGQQLDWWAGALDANGNRLGQATRHGYIVVAVDWAKPDQKEYEYSAREHAAVLVSLRDACRRFSIDTDRVFLSGHSMGGDAAWDMALAHPDLWAGVIPIVAVADKYAAFYSDNAGLVPFYLVAGELDGDKTVRNSRDLERYLNRGFDVTLVEYEGRGHEHFHDEIQNIFDWMGRRHRDFFPKEVATTCMRTWDNYFWWLELDQMPNNSIVEPISWPPRKNFHPVQVKGSIKGNTIYIDTGAERVTLWLSPELVDFEKPVRISVKGQRLNRDPILKPDLLTLLEDVRTRGERLHPFWVKVDSAAPRGAPETSAVPRPQPRVARAR